MSIPAQARDIRSGVEAVAGIDISVTVFAHNPRMDYLLRVLDALRVQTLPMTRWELIVVDNASLEPLASRVDLSWHPNGRVVRNDIPPEQSSLTGARMRGAAEAQGEWLVFTDDDNVEAPDYLECALAIARAHPWLGTFSGTVTLEYEDPAQRLPAELEYLLCKREPAAALWSNDRDHHGSTPWGAGMCVRREVALAYAEKLEREPHRGRLDPSGSQMMFGGDTDMAYVGCAMGYAKGVFPDLRLTHLIPARRCSMDYVMRAIEVRAYSTMLHHWIETGRVLPQRSDLKGRLAGALRWVLMTPMQRRLEAARRRGLERAVRDLPPVTGTGPRHFKTLMIER